MLRQAGNVTLWLLTLLGVLVLSIGVYLFSQKLFPTPIYPASPEDPGQTLCTQDAKQCPDGSYVGRTGPNCEFAACSVTQPNSSPSPVTSIKVYSNQQECESKTGKSCQYSVCDYIPQGKTEEEVCGGKIKKGWYPD